MKIQVLINGLKITVVDEFEKALSYLKTKGATFQIDFKEVDVNLKNLDGYITGMKGYDSVVYVFDRQTEGVSTPTTTMFNGMCVVRMPVGKEEKVQNDGWIWKSIAHEFVHVIDRMLTIRFAIVSGASAVMDTYHKNLELEALDGNFEQAWKLLNPHMYRLFPATIESPKTILKQGSRGQEVKELQSFLKIVADGIFGPMTKASVVDFQKKNSLVADGIVGSNTYKKIDEIKKKPKVDLSKWKLVPDLEEKAQEFLYQCSLKGYELKITQGYRSAKEQNDLYAKGRTSPGPIVTYATASQSKHCYGRAFDISFVGDNPYPYTGDHSIWKKIGYIGENIGLSWGGRWSGVKKDSLHFEI